MSENGCIFSRSENGYGVLRPELVWKMAEIGSGFGDVGGNTPTRNSKEYPPLPTGSEGLFRRTLVF